MKRTPALFLTLLLSFGVVADDEDFEFLIVFGDSLSDPGNHYLAIGESKAAPFLEPVPSASYELGGFRFSNGKTWVERLATELDNKKGGKPALANPGRFTNYAVGRARAREGSPIFPNFHLVEQVEFFLIDSQGEAPRNGLYIVWIGSNDLFEAIAALEFDPTFHTTDDIVEAAIQAIFDSIETLYSKGARVFLVPNLPNAGVTPIAIAQPDVEIPSPPPYPPQIVPFPVIAQIVTQGYNGALKDALTTLELMYHDIKIVRLDTFSLVNELVASPGAFGLKNVTEPCIRLFVAPEASVCNEPNKYLFWDFVHPTQKTHRIFSQRAENALDDFLETSLEQD